MDVKIDRFWPKPDMDVAPDGPFVRYSDYIAAILAERKRCADIADNFHYVLVSKGSGRRGAVAYDIKEAILAGAP